MSCQGGVQPTSDKPDCLLRQTIEPERTAKSGQSERGLLCLMQHREVHLQGGNALCYNSITSSAALRCVGLLAAAVTIHQRQLVPLVAGFLCLDTHVVQYVATSSTVLGPLAVRVRHDVRPLCAFLFSLLLASSRTAAPWSKSLHIDARTGHLVIL